MVSAFTKVLAVQQHGTSILGMTFGHDMLRGYWGVPIYFSYRQVKNSRPQQCSALPLYRKHIGRAWRVWRYGAKAGRLLQEAQPKYQSLREGKEPRLRSEKPPGLTTWAAFDNTANRSPVYNTLRVRIVHGSLCIGFRSRFLKVLWM